MNNDNNYLSAFVDECYQLGLREVVISPGSRSASLALLFENYGKFRTFVAIDERSAGFFALGIAKGLEKAETRPVLLICTSGSAAAHLFPAVTEAKFSRVPLIVLTADRPAELQFVNAPQTMDQTRLYGDFANHFETLSVPSERFYWSYPRKVAQRAVLGAFNPLPGPVQLNVPLFDNLPDLKPENYEKGRATRTFRLVRGKLTTELDTDKLFSKRNLILAGPDATSDYQAALLKLSEQLQAPVLADPLSNVRTLSHANIIDSYDAFLANTDWQQALKPETVLLFGQMPLSKRLQQFIAAQTDSEFIQVDPGLVYRNSAQTTTRLVQSEAAAFIKSIKAVNEDTTFLELWQKAQQLMRRRLNSVENERAAFEGRYVRQLQRLVPASGQLLIANSMAIRDIDTFWLSGLQTAKLYGNRGLNGIDGAESTALGLSTNGKPTVLLTGDLSLLHDLNGLTIGKTERLNLTIVLFNNDGGGIFEYLPQKNAPHFERLFSTPHGLDFSGLAQLVGLDYHLISGYDDFDRTFAALVGQSGLHLLEIKTDKGLSRELHQKYTACHDLPQLATTYDKNLLNRMA